MPPGQPRLPVWRQRWYMVKPVDHERLAALLLALCAGTGRALLVEDDEAIRATIGL